jgi:surface polysaccharide O-acyltransferase-like enzyme
MFAGRISYLSNFKMLYFSGYIGYLVLGYYLSVKEFKPKYNTIQYNTIQYNTIRIIAISLFFIGFLITAFGTYFLSVKYGKVVKSLCDYLTPNVLISSVGVFLFIKSLGSVRGKIFSAIINFIDKYSYGIFLVHILGLKIVSKIGVNAYFVHPIIGIPFTAFLCLIVSGLIIFVVRKLPLGKYISG